ncbi:SRPBCC family protein [Streptomyces sp. NPDC052682]|uniref:aromatase/cyclase n=1 Tax=Streptomyces sp. NPDC052682 TaxID=3154954 RepID=UPI00342F8A35
MASPQAVSDRHEVTVRAAAGEVYRLLADLDAWPWMFPPFVHLERLGRAGEDERVGMWALTGAGEPAGKRIEHWVALRRTDDAALRVEFRPEAVQPPLQSLRRTWSVTAAGDDTCVVRLQHDYRLQDDDPQAAEAVRRTTGEVARSELAALQTAAEIVSRFPELLMTVEDAVDIDGPAEEVYDLLFDAARWPSVMAHVVRAEVRESGPGAHLLELETLERHGGRFTTRTARVGLPHHGIAYKQLLLPPLGSAHHVRWRITPGPHGGTTVTSRQTVVIRESGIPAVLGEGTGLAEGRAFVRSELSGKVRLILDAVKERVEYKRQHQPGDRSGKDA